MVGATMMDMGEVDMVVDVEVSSDDMCSGFIHVYHYFY